MADLDFLLKIGGSLMDFPENLVDLCKLIDRYAGKIKMAIVPGGGWFADAVRKAQSSFPLSEAVAHEMAVLGMDQYACLLSQLIGSSTLVESYGKLFDALEGGRIPIVLPSKLNLKVERRWQATSDSISAYIASQVKPRRLVLVKDVDGVFTNNPKANPSAKLIRELSLKGLAELEESCLDPLFHKYLANARVECVIVNGLNLTQVENALSGRPGIYTVVKPF